MNETFLRKLREREEAEAAAEAARQADAPDDLIPTLPKSVSDESLQLDAILGSITIDKAYERWCNKSPVPRRNQTEGLKVSCPNPRHPDKHPSAWLNTDKGLWNCGSCELGGDLYDIAAWRYGYPVPGYKKTHFRELRERMAGDLGYSKRSSGGTSYFTKSTGVDNPVDVPVEVSTVTSPPGAADDLAPENTEQPDIPGEQTGTITPDDVSTDKAPSTEAAESKLATVTPIVPDEDDLYPFPPIDWRSIATPDTFMAKWMEITTQDDVPEEYHFWNGLTAIALALGRDVELYDRIPVLGNMFICIVGHSGDGKSQSRHHLNEILARTLPYKHTDPNSKGVRRIATPGSAEVLIHQFSKPVVDPIDPKKVAYYAPVRGIVDFNELSAFSGRAGRTGNVLKPVLMQFFDNDTYISTSSMMHGSKEAFDAYACVTTTTQPKAFRDLMHKSDIDSGFLNRWMFVGGVPKKRVAIGGAIIDTRPCDKYLNEIFAWAGAGRKVVWEEDAALAFTEFYDKVMQPNQRRDDTGLLVRIDLTMKKLCLLLAANERKTVVSLEIVQKAVRLYDYLVECYGLSSDAIGNTLHSEIRGEVLKVAQRAKAKDGKGASMRDLNRQLARKKYPMEHLLKVLKFMTELGELEEEVVAGARGPSTKRYHVVD